MKTPLYISVLLVWCLGAKVSELQAQEMPEYPKEAMAVRFEKNAHMFNKMFVDNQMHLLQSMCDFNGVHHSEEEILAFKLFAIEYQSCQQIDTVTSERSSEPSDTSGLTSTYRFVASCRQDSSNRFLIIKQCWPPTQDRYFWIETDVTSWSEYEVEKQKN